MVEMLGYLSTENSPDLDGASMNSIFMATSDDFGKTWQRFEGPQLDGAVIEPYNPRANIDCPGRNAFAITHSNGSASYGAGFHNLNIEWATPQTPFDAGIVDLPNRYEISLRTITRNGVAAVPQTVNITPRRTQQFDVNAGQQCVWTTSDNNGVQTDDSGIVTVDEDSLATVTGITITPNNGTRLVIDCT